MPETEGVERSLYALYAQPDQDAGQPQPVVSQPATQFSNQGPIPPVVAQQQVPAAPTASERAFGPADVYAGYAVGGAQPQQQGAPLQPVDVYAGYAAGGQQGGVVPGIGYAYQADPAAAQPQAIAADPRLATREDGHQYLRTATDEHVAPTQVNAQGVTTRRLGGFYADEQVDAAAFRGAGATWQRDINAEATADRPAPRVSSVTTHYMNEDQQRQNTVGVADGKLVGADGSKYDTSAASGVGTQLRAGQGKHIFSMTPDKQVRAADPWAQKQLTAKQDGSANLGFVNHSSLVAGGEVASAGELTVRDGQLQQISDASGHYRTDGVMLKQALQHFGDKGVDTGNVDIKFAAKSMGATPVIASSQEFLNYEDPNKAEAGMRDHRTKMKAEIAEAARKREERVGDKSMDQIRAEEQQQRDTLAAAAAGKKRDGA